MTNSESAPASEDYPTLSTPPSESPKMSPSNDQPPPHDNESEFATLNSTPEPPPYDDPHCPSMNSTTESPSYDDDSHFPSLNSTTESPPYDDDSNFPSLNSTGEPPPYDYDSHFPSLNSRAQPPPYHDDSQLPDSNSTAPPPPEDYDSHFPSLNSSANMPVVPPQMPASEIRNASSPENSAVFDQSTSPESCTPPRNSALTYQTSSFQYPSSLTPEHKLLKFTHSSPAVPYLADEADDSSPGPAAKYLPRTRSPSDGSDVRWYFCKTALGHDESAASVPTTELVGRGEYFRFGKSDSDTLEAAFLQREEELVSAWWKEYAESREGPAGATSSYDAPPEPAERLTQTNTSDFESSRRLQLNAWEEEENVGVLVKGGLYEVDLLSRRCLPVYWRGDHRRVLRGHWFARKGGLDWLPVREDLSEQLEIAYQSQIWRRRRFQPSGLYAARVGLHGATQGLHALFTGEDDSWEAWLRVETTGISLVLGLRGFGVKLRRGFAMPESTQPTQDEVRQHKEEEMDDYASKVPVRHVVFMVHGIGQRLEKANLVDDVGTFRRIVAMLAEQHLTQYQRDTHRVLFIPCQWRRGLKLGGESAVEDCTLEGVRALRTMLSATVHDVLYYMSPVYCQDVIDSLSHSLNKLYGKFIKRNPNYNGKVSIYGHSLGSVLAYDILCHQTEESSTAAAPIADFKPDAQDAAPSSNGSEIEKRHSLRKDASDSPPDDVSQQNADSVDTAEIERSYTGMELDNNSEGDDESTQKELSKESSPVESEVEALKAEVKMLREELSTLKKEQPVKDEPDSFPLPGSISSVQRASFEISRNDDSEGSDTQGAQSQNALEAIQDGSSTRANPAGDTVEGQLDSKFSSKKHFTPYISYTKLDFKVETFYAVGSPLGVFLSLRNIRIGEGMGQGYWQDDGIEEELPAVRQMMNIFHPYDPVAYRLEPLVCKEYVQKRPIFIPYHKGGKRLHIGIQEFQEDLSARSRAIVNSFSSVGSRVASAFFSSAADRIAKQEEITREKSYGAVMMERLTGGPAGRLDYMLQDSTFEHQYISVLSSHTAYWHDLDTALFILKHLYKDIPEEPPAPPPSLYTIEEDGLNSVEEDSDEVPEFSNPSGAAQIIVAQEDSEPDDYPLTFSSKDVIATAFANASKVKPDWMG